MVQKLGYLDETASQTAGPYVHIGLTPNFSGIAGVYPEDLGAVMVRAGCKGERITVSGRIFDGAGALMRDAMVEIWQADADGLYRSAAERRGKADPNFTGWGRCACDMTTGVFSYETIKPGKVPFRDGRPMAPHITFWIAARGINIGLQTRMYFADEAAANASDPVLARIEHADRIATLLAARELDDVGKPVYTFDIHLQGDRETVFFDI